MGDAERERGWMLVRGERKRGGGSERRWILVSTGMTTSSSLLADKHYELFPWHEIKMKHTTLTSIHSQRQWNNILRAVYLGREEGEKLGVV